MLKCMMNALCSNIYMQKVIRILAKGYLPFSLISSSKLQEIVIEVKEVNMGNQSRL